MPKPDSCQQRAKVASESVRSETEALLKASADGPMGRGLSGLQKEAMRCAGGGRVSAAVHVRWQKAVLKLLVEVHNLKKRPAATVAVHSSITCAQTRGRLPCAHTSASAGSLRGRTTA
jgi:hypothetical protein